MKYSNGRSYKNGRSYELEDWMTNTLVPISYLDVNGTSYPAAKFIFYMKEFGNLLVFGSVNQWTDTIAISDIKSIEIEPVVSDKDVIECALNTILQLGRLDGDHKQYCIDQVVRVLCHDDESLYEEWLNAFQQPDEFGEITYEWSEGIAP